MTSFGDYEKNAHDWITVIESAFYPDYLESARILYSGIMQRFAELVELSRDSADLLRLISREVGTEHIQLLRIFRRYVSPSTSVEMLKEKGQIPEIIRAYSHRFRPLSEVREKVASRPADDEVLAALLWEYKDRGKKGYDLTDAFFTWFAGRFEEEYTIRGPQRAGQDVLLDRVLPGFEHLVPADFLISRKSDGVPLVVGFARYDSDRGGAQEDDRTGGNRDKVTVILNYAAERSLPIKVLFVNDGPGLTLGSMWRDYATLEDYGNGRVMVCTLKMLDERLTEEWLES